MKTIWIPVDFSDTSVNAAEYAVQLFTGIYGVNLTLFHMYEKPEHREPTASALLSLKKRLADLGIVKMDTLAEPGTDLDSCFARATADQAPDLVVMGITGRDKVEQALIGSNTLKLVQHKQCPVLIVPPGARYEPVKHIAFATDFSQLPSEPVAGFLKTLLSSFFAKLHIVHANPESEATLSGSQQQVRAGLEEIFNGFEREFHFIPLSDISEALELLLSEHRVDLIATIPGEHTWLSTLLTGTHTRKLAYRSRLPLLALPG